MQEVLLDAAAQTVLQPQVWFVIVAASCYGVLIGSIPGLTATMAVALFVPMTFWLEPMPAIAAIVSMSACAIFAGDIPTTLVRIPGTPASAAYVDEAYRLAQRGQAQRVLKVSLLSSVIGGLFGSVILIFSGQWLSQIAMLFSVAEYFWLYLLGLSCPILVAQGARLKAFFALLLGLLLSTVGYGAVHAEARFTFGWPELYQGIGFIPAMIGLFGLSEVLSCLAQLGANAPETQEVPSSSIDSAAASEESAARCDPPLLPTLRGILKRKWSVFRSGIVGSGIGILPGAGSDIAAWVAVAMSRNSQDLTAAANELNGPDDDDLNCIADAALANSAAIPSSWIPSLVLGIPGDSITAIVIGVLLMKNIEPGPAIFERQGSLIYSIYMLFILANLVMLPVGLVAIRLGGAIVRVRREVLLPLILMFCLVGSFAVNGSLFDVWIMLWTGLLGFLLERRRIPLGPVVLGIILGSPLEERFIQAISGANDSMFALVERPAAMTLAILTASIWLVVAVRWALRTFNRTL